ncbi:MAG TPA: sigma-70 family RNA polymerase sigma factor [Gaiellaceae bacterium]|jgi:RNA polymerase sigma-70 factor (ECF subfamily)
MVTELLSRARDGDEEAFAALVAPHRRELHVHCYRTLGSLQDAEDALQEILLAAWRGLAGFESRSSLRTWLYRIATNHCLNLMRSAGRRPRSNEPRPDYLLPEATPSPSTEPWWLEPYPDLFLDELPDAAPGPEARYEQRESISLAFVTALQLLPPRQRAALILRDVLGFRASEVAEILESSEESVTSALKRARAGLAETADEPAPSTEVEDELLTRLIAAFEAYDIDGIVALLSDDVRFAMPPLPFEYCGLPAVTRVFSVSAALDSPPRRRLVPTRANRQPAFGLYVEDPGTGRFRATGVWVLTVAGDRIVELTRFETSLLPLFGMPRTLSVG